MPSDGWNVSAISSEWHQLVNADSRGDVAGVIAANNRLNALANQMVLFLWIFYPFNFFVYTSNVQGFYYNPSTYGAYFASMRLNEETAAPARIPSAYGSILFLAIAAAAVTFVLGFIRPQGHPVQAQRGGTSGQHFSVAAGVGSRVTETLAARGTGWEWNYGPEWPDLFWRSET